MFTFFLKTKLVGIDLTLGSEAISQVYRRVETAIKAADRIQAAAAKRREDAVLFHRIRLTLVQLYMIAKTPAFAERLETAASKRTTSISSW